MGTCAQVHKQVLFVIEDELTQAYFHIEAIGDCPIGVQGWHHRTFPASKSVINILEGIADGSIEDPVLWALEAPPS